MSIRARTITDDVIEAITRGVDLTVIRKMGVLYDTAIYLQYLYAHDRSGDMMSSNSDRTHRELCDELGIEPPISSYEANITTCILEIRYRLTGHKHIAIEETQ